MLYAYHLHNKGPFSQNKIFWLYIEAQIECLDAYDTLDFASIWVGLYTCLQSLCSPVPSELGSKFMHMKFLNCKNFWKEKELEIKSMFETCLKAIWATVSVFSLKHICVYIYMYIYSTLVTRCENLKTQCITVAQWKICVPRVSSSTRFFYISAGFLSIDNLSWSQIKTKPPLKNWKPFAKLIWFLLHEVLLSDLDKSRAIFLCFLISFFPWVHIFHLECVPVVLWFHTVLLYAIKY